MGIFAFRPGKTAFLRAHRYCRVFVSGKCTHGRRSKKRVVRVAPSAIRMREKVHETLLCTGDSGGSRNEKSSGSRFVPDMSLFFSQQ